MKVSIKWTYDRPKKPGAVFTSDLLEGEDALSITEDLEKSGRLKQVSFTDEIGSEWTLKELKKLLQKAAEDPKNVIVYFDGGYEKSTKAAGLGAVIYYEIGKTKWRLRVNRSIDELTSNNEAEYAALFEAVTQLEELGVRHQKTIFRGDAQGVLMQLSGEWPCYDAVLARWLDRTEAALAKIGVKAVCETVGRGENKEAHKLAAQALAGESIHGKINLTEEGE